MIGKVKKQVPDGGWGWMVVMGAALANMLNQSLLSLFGLIYGEELLNMGHGITGVAFVMNISSMVTNFSGLFTGYILKKYSYRKVTVCGVLLTSIGMMLSSLSTTIWQIIISYSIFTGLGLGFIMPATFMAIKSYFTLRRSQAVGLSMAGTGIGQMIMPQVVRFLLEVFGYRGTTLILGGLSLNGLVGALLFQPVSWHMKSVDEESLERKTLLEKTNNINTINNEKKHEAQDNVKNDNGSQNEGNKNNSFCNKMMSILDLDLLTDPIYVHIIIGLSLVYTCNIGFSMLFPFFLHEKFDLKYTAICMSISSGADIMARLTIPLIANNFHLGNRMTFLIGASVLALCRSFLAIQSTFYMVVVASILAGYFRAATVINQNLTISEHCDDAKLPAGLGLNMVTKGVFVLSVGQFLGWIRDYSESSSFCIHAQNMVIVAVFVSWCIEIFIRKFRRTSS